VEVSRTPTLGQDGTLADDLLLGVGSVIRRDSDPSRYAGAAKIAYLNTPGTYYYQYKEFVSDYYGAPARNCPDSGPYGGSCTFPSPLYAFTVAAPQPVARPAPVSQPIQANVPRALSVASARRAALKRARSTWHARKAKVDRVRRQNSNRVLCRVAWRTAKGTKRAYWVSVVNMSRTGITTSLA
jgi:hypothetical protein